MWRVPGERCINFPLAESLKRLATDFLVFCMRKAAQHTALPRPCKGNLRQLDFYFADRE